MKILCKTMILLLVLYSCQTWYLTFNRRLWGKYTEHRCMV